MNDNDEEKSRQKQRERLLGGVFLSTVTGISVISGFSYAIAAAKRHEPSSFNKGLENGALLGLRALGWGTLYAVGGVGLLSFGLCTILNVRSASEFRERVHGILHPLFPEVKTANPPGRSDFKSFRELFQYLDDKKPNSHSQVSDISSSGQSSD